ncbi:hypothetical protein C8R44DRAFT_243572 [Mycena epipterygia]|nr:hypothetical protein C8R44DRAFT_243572 [Mycena epipterygia]
MAVRSTPPEILNSIIEHHCTDRKMLFSCSLVSRPWLHSTRYYLFGDLILHLGSLDEAKFLALLNHRLCTFATSVRKIWILPVQERDLAKEVNDNIARLGKLTGVRTLRIHRQRMMPLQTLSALSTAFKNITTLVMMIRFPVFSDAIQFMSSFALLEDVQFEPIRTSPGDSPSTDIRMPRQLRRVQLHSLRGHEKWFADNRVDSLTTLSIERIRPLDDAALLDELLEVFSTNIRHLTLRFVSQKGDFDVQANLSHSTQLRYLEIDL